jgi:hypothetical protein
MCLATSNTCFMTSMWVLQARARRPQGGGVVKQVLRAAAWICVAAAVADRQPDTIPREP